MLLNPNVPAYRAHGVLEGSVYCARISLGFIDPRHIVQEGWVACRAGTYVIRREEEGAAREGAPELRAGIGPWTLDPTVSEPTLGPTGP